MTRRVCLPLLLTALLLMAPMQPGLAASLSFPDSGVLINSQEGWTLVTSETMEEEASFLAEKGIDMDNLRADYAIGHVLFEVFLPGGERVRLATQTTAKTLGWDSIGRMDEAERLEFFASYQKAPYGNAAWSNAYPEMVRSEYAFESGGVLIGSALLSTLRVGNLYTLTATGQGFSMDQLHKTNEAVAAAMVFLSPRSESAFSGEKSTNAIPDPIMDDGVTTPIQLIGFSPVTTMDDTTLTIESVPNIDVLVKTANDTLRGKTDIDGRASFTLSTRRQMVYNYTFTVEAPNRKASRLQVSLERQLTEAAKEEAYRASARSLESFGYKAIEESPKDFLEKPLFFRGSAAGFTDLDGSPCLLLYTANPTPDTWTHPIWVVLQTAVPLSAGDIRVVYGELRGDTLPFTDTVGNTGVAPIVVCRSLVTEDE